MSEDLNHKPGCLWAHTSEVSAISTPRIVYHRVPIDCVTEADLWLRIDSLKAQLRDKDREIVELKAEVYDATHQG